jgi:hypothetical protein
MLTHRNLVANVAQLQPLQNSKSAFRSTRLPKSASGKILRKDLWPA